MKFVTRQPPTFSPARKTAPVSVVIPCYRCMQTVGATVASIAAQTLLPAEVLLVDDGSGDGTAEGLERLASRYPDGWIKVIALRHNGGAARARNLGWQRARHDHIAFLDSDDTWFPNKLELQMPLLRAHPGIALISHRMDVRQRSLPPPPPVYPLRARALDRRAFLLHNPFRTGSVVLRSDIPFRFNEKFRLVEDFLLWSQIALSGFLCVKINQVLAATHKPAYGAGGLSADIGAMHQAGLEVRQELRRQGLISPAEHYISRPVGWCRRMRRNLVMLSRRTTNRRRRPRACFVWPYFESSQSLPQQRRDGPAFNAGRRHTDFGPAWPVGSEKRCSTLDDTSR
ncbi:glycosyltransferase family 2 protein [Cognatiluteimonas profundi]|uniref:glycosyltransferase family 2 protein n=1 Tax=Cognatiluteimonas profundi TaxID=2594501 RepID=UPI00131A616B|nr:glycosyltransferase family 2 protein [Lysobacter profundi]